MRSIRQSSAEALRRLGLDLRARRNVPFGVRWEDDLAYCLQGRPLRVAVDVGAHFGETARRVAASFPGARVHCFEPIPTSFRRLERAVAGLDAVCVQAALSDEPGTVEMGLGESSFSSGFGAAGTRIDVRVDTLDAYVAQAAIESVELLKVDVEGHEPSVLRGATGLLATGRIEHVLCECEFVHRPDEPHGDFAEIVRILLPHGFRVVSFYTGGVDGLGWRWGDVLFRRPRPQSTAVACSPHDRGAQAGRSGA